MKLYNKNLSSMADLEREKRRLQKEKELLEEEGIISFDEVVAAVGSSNALGGKLPLIVSIASRVAPLVGTFAGPIVNVVQNLFTNRAGKNESERLEADDASEKGNSKIKGTLFSLGREIVGSYLKWKAVELSYHGIKLIVKKQKGKKSNKNKA